MRVQLQLPQLWDSTKYVSWPRTLAHPVVRVPRPSGTPLSRSIPWQVTEYDTFVACVDYRDRVGPEIWGERRWMELLNVRKRSVAKHRASPAGPITGVNHYAAPGRAPVWIALWYELQGDGTRKKCSNHFSYGTTSACFSTSEQAMQAAIAHRQAMEARWYSTLGIGEGREASKLDAGVG